MPTPFWIVQCQSSFLAGHQNHCNLLHVRRDNYWKDSVPVKTFSNENSVNDKTAFLTDFKLIKTACFTEAVGTWCTLGVWPQKLTLHTREKPSAHTKLKQKPTNEGEEMMEWGIVGWAVQERCGSPRCMGNKGTTLGFLPPNYWHLLIDLTALNHNLIPNFQTFFADAEKHGSVEIVQVGVAAEHTPRVSR